MVTVSTPDRREIIAEALFLTDTIGRMTAKHSDEGPVIEIVIEPEGTDEHAEFGLAPCEARTLAAELVKLADLAQTAGWTPAVLAHVRERYLARASDEEIKDRLDELADRLGSSPLGFRPGEISTEAGRMLTAGVGGQAVDRAVVALDGVLERLSGLGLAADELASLRVAFTDVQGYYRTEQEGESL